MSIVAGETPEQESRPIFFYLKNISFSRIGKDNRTRTQQQSFGEIDK